VRAAIARATELNDEARRKRRACSLLTASRRKKSEPPNAWPSSIRQLDERSRKASRMVRPFAGFALACVTLTWRWVPGRAVPGVPFLSRSASRLRARPAEALAACAAASAFRMIMVTLGAGNARTNDARMEFLSIVHE